MKTIIKSIILIIFPVLLSAQTYTEILGRPTDNAITISVMFDANVDVYFEYGTSKSTYSNNSVTFSCTSGIPQETDLTGLLPSTRYYYRTRYRKTGTSTYLASTEHTFITQRSRGNSFCFTVEADPHPYDKKGCWNLWTTCLNNQLADSADFMIDMGDTFGDDHNPFTITNTEIQQLQLNCRNFFGKVCHSMPFYFCIGNHEGECGYYLLQTPPNNLATYETLWRKQYFPNPYPNGFYSGCEISEGYGMNLPENYFAYEWGDALIVVLDVYRYATANEKPQKWDFTIGKTQYDWFKRTLENSTAKFKMVFAHHILGQGRGGVELAKSFEWGGYDAGTYKFDTYRTGWGLPLHQLMKANNVDIFFQGHDHIFVKQDLDGIVYQSVPMPSDSTYKIGVTDNGSAYLSGDQLDGSGHLRVSVSADSLNVAYINALLPADETSTLKNKQIRYSYTIKKASTLINEPTYNKEIWTIYPNPVKDELRISISKELNGFEIDVLNLDGKILLHKKEAGQRNELRMDMKNLKSGIYLVRLKYNGCIYMNKVIVL